MRSLLRVLATVTGVVLGSLIGGTLLFWGVLGAVDALSPFGEEDNALGGLILIGGLTFLVGAAVGAAAGAIVTRRVLRQNGSAQRALIGAVIGLLVGGSAGSCLWCLHVDLGPGWAFTTCAIVATPAFLGVVVGSGWKAKPADRGTKEGVPPASD
jgi:hypothetical protein